MRKADIGVAMGITGTEVSKDASAMILSDDNFATIIKAVLNGRNVYRNIINSIQFYSFLFDCFELHSNYFRFVSFVYSFLFSFLLELSSNCHADH